MWSTQWRDHGDTPISKERVEDITPAVYAINDQLIQDAYRYVFGSLIPKLEQK
ncbi:MAG: hypothetical protein ACE15E_05225 [Acidobacteriota bacterium]